MESYNYSLDTDRLTPKNWADLDAVWNAVWAGCAAQGFELNTRKEYARWAKRFGLWLWLRPREVVLATPAEKIRGFLFWLADGQGINRPLSAVSLDQARHALLFLYQKVRLEPVGDIGLIPVAKRPKTLPHVMSPEQVERLLGALVDGPAAPYRLIAELLRVTSARICDVLNLRVQDIDWRNSELIFRRGKGGKDRRVPLPCALLPMLKTQLRYARALYDRDQAAGIPVALPPSVFNKSPRYGFAPLWFWVFPAPGHCQHPDHKHTVRWRIHEGSVQRAFRAAAAKTGLQGLATPHRLRHASATQLLDGGVPIRHVQELLGHESVETTMIYTHVEIRDPRMRSALDQLVTVQPRREALTV